MSQDPANACQWFSPDPFGPQGNVVPEGWGYPLEVAIRGPFDDVRAQETDPEAVDVLVDEDLLVQGHRAVRLEYETLNDVVGENGLHYEYVIEFDPETTLIVHTTATRGVVGVYAENKVVVDRAVDTLRFFLTMPTAPPAGRRRPPLHRSGYPSPVRPPDRPGCFLCHRPTFDPDKRAVPWARAVAGRRQVLICPDCQRDRPDWQESLDRCAACGSTRLSVTLGDVVCRACGHADSGGAGA